MKMSDDKPIPHLTESSDDNSDKSCSESSDEEEDSVTDKVSFHTLIVELWFDIF